MVYIVWLMTPVKKIIPVLAAAATALLLSAGCAMQKPESIAFRKRPCEPGKRAIWVWNTDEIKSVNEIHDFIEFCAGNKVGLAFIYLKGAPAEAGKLITACGRNNIRVHALKGSPRMARKEHHNEALVFIEQVAIYNAQAASEARIEGIHLDVEPYLLKEFSPETADGVFKEYLELLHKVRTRIREIDHTLLFGADIPFWLDHFDEAGNHRYELKYRRRKKPVSEHVIDLTDYICVMAYRNFLHGSDGAINLAMNEVRYASTRNKNVFVGLETGSGQNIPGKTTFAGKSRQTFEAAVYEAEKILNSENAFAGMAIHHYDSWRGLR